MLSKYSAVMEHVHKLEPSKLRVFGQLKYLTFQCLLIQLLNAILHVLGHFSSSLRKPRDLVFTTLAYPVGSIVVYSFWAVWFLMGREVIFPIVLSQYFADWMNHVMHTIIAPINIMSAVLVNHKYTRNGFMITLVFFITYLSLLFYIRNYAGQFVYKYLDTLADGELVVYFAFTALMAYMLYKSGQLITSLFHKPASQRPEVKSKKSKQR